MGRRVLEILGIGILLYLFASSMIVALTAEAGWKWTYVKSWSMFPTIVPGDIVLLESPGNVSRGDIVVFYDRDLVIHRVIGVERYGGKVYVVAKGDFNNFYEEWLIENLRYKVVSVAGMPVKLPLTGFIFWLRDILTGR